MNDEIKTDMPVSETPASTLNISTTAAPISLPEFAADATLTEKVVQVLNTIHDPEIPVNIYELGLVYDVDAAADGEVTITMTLTDAELPGRRLDGPPRSRPRSAPSPASPKAHVNLVWEPTWTPERMYRSGQIGIGLAVSHQERAMSNVNASD